MPGNTTALRELRRKMDEQAQQMAELRADLRRRLGADDGAPEISRGTARGRLDSYYGEADPTGREQRARRRGWRTGGEDGDDE